MVRFAADWFGHVRPSRKLGACWGSPLSPMDATRYRLAVPVLSRLPHLLAYRLTLPLPNANALDGTADEMDETLGTLGAQYALGVDTPDGSRFLLASPVLVSAC